MYSSNPYITPIQIRVLDRPHDHWQQYVVENQAATIFHQVGFLSLLADYFKLTAYYCHAFDQKEQLLGVLPLMLFNNLLQGKALISLPHCVYGGVLANHPQIANALTSCAVELAKAQKVDFLLLKSRQADEAVISGLYYNFHKKLASSAAENWEKIDKKKRADIRKARKYGLSVQIHQDVGLFYRHYGISLRRLGTPILDQSYFEQLMLCLGDACQIFTTFYEGRAVASVMVFFFRNEVMPYYAGGLDETRDLHAYDFIYWFLMEYAITHGYEYFNFGRSRVGTGSFDYKRHWGFQAQPLQYQHWAISDATQDGWSLHPNHPKWQLPIKVWQRLPLWLTFKIGPWIAKQLA